MTLPNHLSSGTRVGCIILLVVFLVPVFAGLCSGDQLQWNPFSVCRDAARVITRLPILVSFCSLADEDYVELWLVRDLHAAATSTSGLYEIIVSAERLYRSDCAFSSEDFPVPEEQWSYHKTEGFIWSAVGVDLAYVYVYVGGRSFQCLGQVLGLSCTVEVDTIRLPDPVMAEIAARLGTTCRPAQRLLDVFDRCPQFGR
jgi:hypothetical protein